MKCLRPIYIYLVYLLEMLLLPPATKLEQGYVFTGVCHSVNGAGGGEVPDQVHPPEPGTPQDQVHPPR